MGQDRAGLRREAPLTDVIPPEWTGPVRCLIDRLERAYDVRCVILHGSVATGDWTRGSDVDLVVIADGLPPDFLRRLEAVSDLCPRGAPIEILPYTPEEFSEMLETMHVTALEAASRGIALAGESYFNDLNARTEAMMKRGLRRGKCSWYWENDSDLQIPK